MTGRDELVEVEEIRSLIITLPNRPPFMLAEDLATIYQRETREIGQAVKRNPRRFPDDFAFQLSPEEHEGVLSQRSQSVTSQQNHILSYAPLAFTREGANMLSAVLHTPTAVARSVMIMRAFSRIEEVAAQPVASTELLALEVAALGRDLRQAQRELQMIWQIVTRPVPPEPVTLPDRRRAPTQRPSTSKIARDDEVRAFLDGLEGSDTIQAIWLMAVQEFGRPRMPSLSATYLYFTRKREGQR